MLNNYSYDEELRSYQIETIDNMDELDKKVKFSTIISLPTGAGKTRLAMEFCLSRLAGGHKVLWLADKINLLEQTQNVFQESGKFDYCIHQMIFSSNGNSVSEIKKDTQMLFASVSSITSVAKQESESFRAWVKESQKNKKKLYVVYDEAHHIGADDIRKFFESLFTDLETVDIHYNVSRFTLIGLTATVFRNDRVNDCFYDWFKDGYKNNIPVHLSTEYGVSKKPTDNEIKNNMIETVKLADLLGSILVNPKLYKVDDYAHGIPASSVEEMDYLALRTFKYHNNWGKTIIFVKDRTQAMLLSMKLHDAGIKCFAYISEQGIDKIGKEVTEKFTNECYETIRDKDGSKGENFRSEKSKYQLMVAVNKVSEGYDVPDLNTVYLYAPIQSHIQLRQRIGRVLRNTDNYRERKEFKPANVYWQSYPVKKDDEDIIPKLKVADIPDAFEKIVPQTAEEQLTDINAYNEALANGKTMQIPAAMFKEELPDTLYKGDNFYSGYEFLEILKMFGTSMVESESIGYFSDMNESSLEDVIYVGERERNGYIQLYNTIRVDYRSKMHWMGKCVSDFSEYAEIMGFSDADLLEDIKKTCFYMSSIDKSDTKMVLHNRKIKVTDDEIMKFCRWVLENEISMPSYHEVSDINSTEPTKTEENVILASCIKEYYEENTDVTRPETMEQVIEQIADIQRWKNLKKLETHTMNKPKEYTDSLVYGVKRDFIYQEMISARSLIRMGAVKYPRFQGLLDEQNIELAFVGFEAGKTLYIRPKKRICENRIANNDILLIANAIIHTVNHVCVNQNEVKEYQKMLIEALQKAFDISIEDLSKGYSSEDNLTTEDKVTIEFLMALGYSYSYIPVEDINVDTDNDRLLRMQCKIFEDSLPAIIRYVIYDRVYVNLYSYVSYYDSEGNVHTECQNREELKERYKVILDKYGVDASALEGVDLTPLEDVIYDYRPYIKTVQNYQGIKPEFLCRLVNDVFQLDMNTCFDTFVDGFGGSGACSMNTFYKNIAIKPERIYNDFGDINVAFYRCLDRAEDVGKIKGKINELFVNALSFARGREEDAEDTAFLQDIFGLYCSEVLDSMPSDEEIEQIEDVEKKKSKRSRKHTASVSVEYLSISIDDIEKKYLNVGDDVKDVEKLLETIEEAKEDKKNLTSSEKIFIANEAYERVFTSLEYSIEQDCFNVRRFEKYLHAMMLRIKRIYLLLEADEGIVDILEDWQKAFVFFMTNSLGGREFYSDCLIGSLIEFYGSYAERLSRGSEWMRGVKRCSGDALELLRDKKLNKPSTKFYLDIPYSETDASTYFVDGFDEAGFFDCLADLKGSYLVSSRHNICIPKDTSEKNYSEGFCKKMQGVLEFYSSFLQSKEYEKLLEGNKNVDTNYKVGDIGDNEARYVLFPFTKKIRGRKNAGVDKPELSEVLLNTKLTSEDIGRMLTGTQEGDVPVEVMVTNAELNLDRKPIQKIDSDIWVMPTFKTGVDSAQYKAEPVIVIMKYSAYLKTLYKTLLPEAWKIYSNKKDAKTIVRNAGAMWGFNFK